MIDINYPLVELKRPPIYTAMKYWGKKPHNIWAAYICNYTKRGGTILDPFSGSAIAAFEAVKNGRTAYAFDINPLTSFCIEALCSKYDEILLKHTVECIIGEIIEDPVYKQMFSARCPKCGGPAWIQHCKWNNNSIYEVGVKCTHCDERILMFPTLDMVNISIVQEKLAIPYWYPQEKFNSSPSYTKSFINNIGGNDFSHLWTKRNLYVLSKIFDKILKTESTDLQLQLLFGFIQIVHLSSKMCVPRSAKSNRNFSTSWGRPAYMCSHKKMEMNPLMLFEGACFGKQSASSALCSVQSYIGKTPKIHDVTSTVPNNNADIYYGVVNVLELTKYIPDKSIDFIITDPPYGGLIQYLDLSYIWIIWLQKYNKKYKPNFNSEITIKNGVKSVADFQKDFTDSAIEISRVLKDDAKVIFTFNNKDVSIWRSFLLAIQQAGFVIEQIIYQPNRRTGESNVGNNNGTSANDFYIRCVKKANDSRPILNEDCEDFVIKQAKDIITQRAEPTPMSILFACLLTRISLQGFYLTNFDADFESILIKHIGREFEITQNGSQKCLWLRNTTIKVCKTLTYRLELYIKSLAKKYPNESIDIWLEHIYRKYNNTLTPTRECIEQIISNI